MARLALDQAPPAGAQHNDAAVVAWLTAAAPAAIDWLQAQGVAFDRTADGALQLGREGGHATARIVHAGGDASGARCAGVRPLQVSHVKTGRRPTGTLGIPPPPSIS